MSDFLTRLAEKALGIAPAVRPVIAPRFAPGPLPRGEHDVPVLEGSYFDPDVETSPGAAHPTPQPQLDDLESSWVADDDGQLLSPSVPDSARAETTRLTGPPPKEARHKGVPPASAADEDASDGAPSGRDAEAEVGDIQAEPPGGPSIPSAEPAQRDVAGSSASAGPTQTGDVEMTAEGEGQGQPETRAPGRRSDAAAGRTHRRRQSSKIDQGEPARPAPDEPGPRQIEHLPSPSEAGSSQTRPRRTKAPPDKSNTSLLPVKPGQARRDRGVRRHPQPAQNRPPACARRRRQRRRHRQLS